MTRLALCLLLLATGASASELPKGIQAVHDDERGATCWTIGTIYRSGIHCIPDSQLQASNERQLSPHEKRDNGPTPATTLAPWNEERYLL